MISSSTCWSSSPGGDFLHITHTPHPADAADDVLADADDVLADADDVLSAAEIDNIQESGIWRNERNIELGCLALLEHVGRHASAIEK